MEGTLRKFKELTEIAKKAGYSSAGAKDFITDPPGYVEDMIGPQIANALTPETITALFNSLEGKSATNAKSLIDLANVLYRFETHLDKQENQNLTVAEIKLLSFTNKLLEKSLYRGGLSQLSEKNAAALAFLINRLAKIAGMSESEAEIKGFDVEKFELFVTDVQAFVDQYLTENTIDQLLLENDREMAAVEEHISQSDDPQIISWIKNAHEKQADEERLAELINGEIKLAIRDIIIRLRNIIQLYEAVNSHPLEKHQREQINYLIFCLESLTDEKIAAIVDAKQQGKPGAKILRTALLSVRLDEKKAGIKQNQYTEHDLVETVRSCIRLLKKFKKETDHKTKSKNWSWLRNKELADKIDYPLLQTAEELATLDKSGIGIWEELEHLILNLAAGEKDADVAPLATEPIVNNYRLLAKKRKMLLAERALIPSYRDQFKYSKEVVLRDIQQSSTADLYFLKTILVGSDIIARQRFWGYFGLYQDFVPHAIKSHKMLGYEDYHLALPRNDSKKTSYDNKYSDIHYKSSQLPFAIMVARYFQEKKKQPSIKTQAMPSAKDQTETEGGV